MTLAHKVLTGHGGLMTPRAPNPPLAALLTLLAAAFVAGTTLLAKALGTGSFGAWDLGPPLHPLQISQGRFLFALVAILAFVALARPQLERPHLPLHVARSAFGWGGVTLMFAAAAFIPLSDATAISFLNPVFAMMLAIPFLGERVGRVRWSAALIALVGGVILTRPGVAAIELGALLALAAPMMFGAEVILISSSAAKLETAGALGADHLINYRETERWDKPALEITGGVGVDHVVEVGGAGTLDKAINAVRPSGAISLIGVLGGGEAAVSLGKIVTRNIRLQGVTLGGRDMFERMAAAMAEHQIRPVIDEQDFELQELGQALANLSKGGHVGKVVCEL